MHILHFFHCGAQAGITESSYSEAFKKQQPDLIHFIVVSFITLWFICLKAQPGMFTRTFF